MCPCSKIAKKVKITLPYCMRRSATARETIRSFKAWLILAPPVLIRVKCPSLCIPRRRSATARKTMRRFLKVVHFSLSRANSVKCHSFYA